MRAYIRLVSLFPITPSSKAGVDTTIYLDHQYYDEAILSAIGMAASELLG